MSQVASRLRGEGGEGLGRGLSWHVLSSHRESFRFSFSFLSHPPLILVKSELELTNHMARDKIGETLAATTDQKPPSSGCVSGRERPREARSFTSLIVPRLGHSIGCSQSPLIFTALSACTLSLHMGTCSSKSSRPNPYLHEFCRHRKPLVCSPGVFDRITETYILVAKYEIYISVLWRHSIVGVYVFDSVSRLASTSAWTFITNAHMHGWFILHILSLPPYLYPYPLPPSLSLSLFLLPSLSLSLSLPPSLFIPPSLPPSPPTSFYSYLYSLLLFPPLPSIPFLLFSLLQSSSCGLHSLSRVSQR